MLPFLLYAVSQQTTSDAHRIVVQHRPAESILDMLRPDGIPHLIPTGLQVILDTRDNTFIVNGPEEGFNEFRRLVEQFDQEPMRVKVRAVAVWPLIGWERSSESVVYNSESWSLGDTKTSCYIEAKTRIQVTGEIEVEAQAHQGRDTAVFHGKVRPGDAIVFDGDEAWATSESTDLATLVTRRRTGQRSLFRTDALETVGVKLAMTVEILPSKLKK